LAVFVDTSIFVAVANKRDTNHARATQLMEEALRAKYGVIYTSDYVIDETITTALARTHKHEIAVKAGKDLIESPRIEKVNVGEREFSTAWSRFQKLRERPMSFTDCTTIAIIEGRGISRIMSFDSGFDGLVTRVS